MNPVQNSSNILTALPTECVKDKLFPYLTKRDFKSLACVSSGLNEFTIQILKSYIPRSISFFARDIPKQSLSNESKLRLEVIRVKTRDNDFNCDSVEELYCMAYPEVDLVLRIGQKHVFKHATNPIVEDIGRDMMVKRAQGLLSESFSNQFLCYQDVLEDKYRNLNYILRDLLETGALDEVEILPGRLFSLESQLDYRSFGENNASKMLLEYGHVERAERVALSITNQFPEVKSDALEELCDFFVASQDFDQACLIASNIPMQTRKADKLHEIKGLKIEHSFNLEIERVLSLPDPEKNFGLRTVCQGMAELGMFTRARQVAEDITNPKIKNNCLRYIASHEWKNNLQTNCVIS